MTDQRITLTPLGGLGEIGMNCMLLETNEDMIVIDCGLMFPDDFMLGVDVVIPRFDYIFANKRKLRGVVLTHGHEDHIGALPWLMNQVDAPIYGSEFTLALVRNKLTEHGLADETEFAVVGPRERVEMGGLAVNFFPVCHSIINGYGLGIETPVGNIIHTGDFKIDKQPMDGHATDLEAFRNFAGEGALLLMSDSTNVEREGYALTEREIMSSLDDIFAAAEGRILVTLFSSHIQRIQEIIDLAGKYNRKVAVSGRSLAGNIDLAMRLELLRADKGTCIQIDETAMLADEQIVLLVTGSQGEPLSALTRIAMGDHRYISVKPGDLVLMSSRFIPGNVKAITRVINSLYRLGAEVLYENVQGIHASGHAHRDELRVMLETVKPKYFLPVHGEYRHLVKHSRLAVECGVAPERSLVLEDGDPLTLLPDGVRFEERRFIDSIYVDGKGVGDVGRSVIKERRLLGDEGMVVVVVVLDEKTGDIMVGPEISSKGFVFEQHFDYLLEDAKCVAIEVLEETPHDDIVRLKDRMRSTLRRFFRSIIDRDPVVVPLVISI